MNKMKLLEDRKAFESVFRNGGWIEFDAEYEGGEDGSITRSEKFDYTVREYLSTSDASMFFPRVVSNQLLEAAEPVLLVTPLLNTVRIGSTASTVDYFAVGAIQAHEIPEGMEYPEEQAVWSKAAKTAKVTKKGLKVPVTQEMVDDNLFDVMAMYVRAAGRAMARYKEQLALRRFQAVAFPVFDNTNNNMLTTGINSAGEANKSLDGRDLLKIFGTMLASGRVPTDVIMHPMAWTLWADDPIIRNLSVYTQPVSNKVEGGHLADGSVAGKTFDGFIAKTAPFGINIITSPYVPFTPATSTNAAITDIYVVDRSDLGVITVRDDMSTDTFEDPSRDIVAMKVKERYDITVLDTEGYNIAVAKNVHVARNFQHEVSFRSDHTGLFPGELA